MAKPILVTMQIDLELLRDGLVNEQRKWELEMQKRPRGSSTWLEAEDKWRRLAMMIEQAEAFY